MKIPDTEYLRIKVIPKSTSNEIVEIMEDSEGNKTIKIRIKALPIKGKANTELIKFLSKILQIEKEKISIIGGKTEQIKLIKIDRNGSH